MKRALIVVDVQNDFCGPSAALPVPDGRAVINPINNLMLNGGYDKIVLTQDWHPLNHSSFRSNNNHGPWPNHCVQGTWSADFHPELNARLANMIIRKGTNPDIDSYSGFVENDQETRTGLHGYLRECGVDGVDVVGLAFDYCVKYTAVDARDLDYFTRIILPCTRAINPNFVLNEHDIELITSI